MTAETIGGRLGEERRRAELFRKGFVSAIDQTVTPWLANVHGRWMPFINDSITVGDVVLWVDQADPFAWLPIIDLIDGGAGATFPTFGETGVGGWAPEMDQDGGSGSRLVHGPYLRVDPTFGTIWWPGGAVILSSNFIPEEVGEVDYLAKPLGIGLEPDNAGIQGPMGATPPEPTGGVVDLLNLGGASTLATYTGDIGEGDMFGWYPRMTGYTYVLPAPFSGDPTTYSLTNYNTRWVILRSATGIRSKAIATGLTTMTAGVPAYFPPLRAPGPNWWIVYIAQFVPLPAGAPGTTNNLSCGSDQPEYNDDFTIRYMRRPRFVSGNLGRDDESITTSGFTHIVFAQSKELTEFDVWIELDDGPDRRVALSTLVLTS